MSTQVAVRYTVIGPKKNVSKRFTGATLGEVDQRGSLWASTYAARVGGTYRRKLILKDGKRVTFI